MSGKTFFAICVIISVLGSFAIGFSVGLIISDVIAYNYVKTLEDEKIARVSQ